MISYEGLATAISDLVIPCDPQLRYVYWVTDEPIVGVSRTSARPRGDHIGR